MSALIGQPIRTVECPNFQNDILAGH